MGLLLVGCAPAPPVAEVSAQVVAPVEDSAVPSWPDPDAPLHHPVLEASPEFAPRGVFLVAGHGAPGNAGNTGCACQIEQDTNLATTAHLAATLGATGLFAVTQARTGTARPSYRARLRHLQRAGSEVMLELHTDSRGWDFLPTRQLPDGTWCYRSDDDPGFAILVRDQGPAAEVAERLALARALATSLAEVGLPPYHGLDYGRLYDLDPTPGVFLDRRGLFMLRKATVPAVIIETHNALDSRESARWTEEATLDAFSRAVAAGLLVYFEG